MIKRIVSSTLLGLGLVMAVSANAAVFDFAAIADGDGSYGPDGREHGMSSFTFSKDGLSVTTTGFNTKTSDSYFAYLDSGNAGLGVCQQLNGDNDQCKVGSDDNVTFDESLKLVFDQSVTISETTFLNGQHGTTFTGNFDLSIDGGPVTTIALANIFSTPLTGTEFIFSNPITGGAPGEQFYISSLDVTPVPVPAAVWMFGSGLIGLGRFARRKA
jgi:hypothetical protein